MRNERTQTAKKVRAAQKTEITEHIIYHKLSRSTKDVRNKEVLLRISQDELRHYNFWKEYTKHVERPNWIKVWAYYLISRILGLTFGIKLMERGEGAAEDDYRKMANIVPHALDIAKEEDEHEQEER